MAGTELHAPIYAAIVAVPALALFVFAAPLSATLPRWAFVLPSFAFLGATLWGWIATYRRIQSLEDIPLSRIGSAAQGYARIEGRAARLPGRPLESPLTGWACCWYRFKVVERDDERGSKSSDENETSEWSFMVTDATGECVVDPVGARLVPLRTRRWVHGNFVYRESLILPGDPLVVVGQFASSGSSVTEFDIEFKAGLLLAEWKQDMPALNKRFGLKGEGQILAQEWERVRSEARREVEAEIARDPPQAQNLIAKPDDGRPYVISAKSQAQLERDLKIWAGLHLACFLAGAAVLAATVLGHP